MREEILLSHLKKSDFSQVQAETLSKILSEMAPREYLEAQFAVVNERLERMATKAELSREMTKQTRWIIVAVGLLAALLGLPATILGVLNYVG